MKTYVVYILTCSDGSYYTGITSNFNQRMIQHQVGCFRTCYTFKRRPVTLQYHLEFSEVIQAILFEKKVKGWTRAKKQALIQGNFNYIKVLAECRNFTHSKYKPDMC